MGNLKPAMRGRALVDVVDTWDEAARLDRPPLIVRESLMACLDALGLGSESLVINRIGEGHSNATFLIERTGLECVLRRPPRPPYPRHAHNVGREARTQAALASSSVPVPQILASVEDPTVLGAPFYLMNLLRGHVVTTRLPEVLSGPETRTAMIADLVDTVAALHAVDPADVGLAELDRGPGFIDRQLALFDTLWIDNQAREVPQMERARGWLEANRPQDSSRALTHGDYRLGNVMFADSEQGRVEAVLDWELCSVGDPMADVGYLISTLTEPDDPVGPLFELASALRDGGFPTRRDVAQRYAVTSGRDIDKHLRWYVAFAFWRTAVGLEGFYKRSLAGTIEDEFIDGLEHGIPQLAESALAAAYDGAFW